MSLLGLLFCGKELAAADETRRALNKKIDELSVWLDNSRKDAETARNECERWKSMVARMLECDQIRNAWQQVPTEQDAAVLRTGSPLPPDSGR